MSVYFSSPVEAVSAGAVSAGAVSAGAVSAAALSAGAVSDVSVVSVAVSAGAGASALPPHPTTEKAITAARLSPKTFFSFIIKPPLKFKKFCNLSDRQLLFPVVYVTLI